MCRVSAKSSQAAGGGGGGAGTLKNRVLSAALADSANRDGSRHSPFMAANAKTITSSKGNSTTRCRTMADTSLKQTLAP